MNDNATPISKILDWNMNVEPIQNEVLLDLDLDVLEPDTAINAIDDFHETIQQNAQHLDELIITIPNEKFVQLFLEATEMHSGTGEYITGLRINYGLLNGNVSPIFQPTYMRKDSTKDTFYLTHGQHYVYDNRALPNPHFRLASEDEFDSIAFYQRKVKIIHFGSNQYGPFINGNDAMATTFTFQTIFSLIVDNLENSNVYLYNAIRRTDFTGTNEVKHCIFLSTSVKPFEKAQMFEDKLANRSHLCPPGCSEISTLIIHRP